MSCSSSWLGVVSASKLCLLNGEIFTIYRIQTKPFSALSMLCLAAYWTNSNGGQWTLCLCLSRVVHVSYTNSREWNTSVPFTYPPFDCRISSMTFLKSCSDYCHWYQLTFPSSSPSFQWSSFMFDRPTISIPRKWVVETGKEIKKIFVFVCFCVHFERSLCTALVAPSFEETRRTNGSASGTSFSVVHLPLSSSNLEAVPSSSIEVTCNKICFG